MTCEPEMPPPRKVLKLGSRELEEAVEAGEVVLSLERSEWNNSLPNEWNGNCNPMRGTTNSTAHPTNYERHKDISGESSRSADYMTAADSPPSNCAALKPGSPSRLPCPTSCEEKISKKKSCSRASEDRELNPESPESKTPRFSDIIGHAAVKLRLDEVLLPLALPQKLADSILTGVRSMPASILLFGPPGCGKTQLAKAIAGEAHAAFLSVGPSDVLSKFVGESESSIRALFDSAYEKARETESKTAVLFFDEIDALGQARGGSSFSDSSASTDPSSRRILAELLIQLNRINTSRNCTESYGSLSEEDVSVISAEADSVDTITISSPTNEPVRVLVVAATNRPEDCDPALLRRFSIRVLVNLPTRRDRFKILTRFLEGIDHSVSRSQLDSLAIDTEGWTGSDLETLTREAAMAPVRECIRSAALLKRRAAKTNGLNALDDPNVAAKRMSREESHSRLLDSFSNLRPVSMQDFQDAIDFLAWNQNGVDSTGAGASGNDLDQRIARYDSSSDEEE